MSRYVGFHDVRPANFLMVGGAAGGYTDLMEERKLIMPRLNPERWQALSDRMRLVLLGLGILALGFVGAKPIWALFGAIPLVAGLVGVDFRHPLAAIRPRINGLGTGLHRKRD